VIACPIWEQSSLTLSSHCFFGLPTGLVPWVWPYNITFGYLDGFILTTCLKYVKRRVWMTSTISHSKCSSLRISMFLKRALLVIPSILRKTDISNTRSALLLSSLRVRVSALYKSTELEFRRSLLGNPVPVQVADHFLPAPCSVVRWSR